MSKIAILMPANRVSWSWTFHSDQSEPFTAMRAAEQFLDTRGFSIGAAEVDGEIRGVMYGDDPVPRWKQMHIRGKAQLHGVMVGDMRHGPLKIQIFKHAPAIAIAAVAAPPYVPIPLELCSKTTERKSNAFTA